MGEICIFRVKGTETVMMFSGENHVFDSSILHYIRPLFWIEVNWI